MAASHDPKGNHLLASLPERVIRYSRGHISVLDRPIMTRIKSIR
jgi:type II secretory pathway component GspD/PulD (secretin)